MYSPKLFYPMTDQDLAGSKAVQFIGETFVAVIVVLGSGLIVSGDGSILIMGLMWFIASIGLIMRLFDHIGDLIDEKMDVHVEGKVGEDVDGSVDATADD